jgi:hypothetical protein
VAACAGELAGDHGDLDRPPVDTGHDMARDVVVPQHGEMRRRPSCRRPAGSSRSGTARACSAIGREEREHLGVHDAAPRRHPLHVATP